MSHQQIADIYPLSHMQQGMLFSTLLAPGSGVYVEQRSCRLHGKLDPTAFERAWQRVCERHAVLRTSFVWEGVEQPVQIVHKSVELPFERLDWGRLDAAERDARLEEHLRQDRRRGFDLSEAPLSRLTLIRLGEDSYHFIWTYHHLLMDGWSGPLIVKEVFAFYQAFCRGESLELPALPAYRDYIAWLQQQDLEDAERFWRDTLKGFKSPVPVGTRRTPDAIQSAGDGTGGAGAEGASGTYRARLPRELSRGLAAWVREHKLTLNALLRCAWALLLSRYSGESDIVFGAVVAGRPAELPGVESMVGLFINTLPVRVRVSHDEALLPYLKRIQAQQFEAQSYEYSPLVQVQGWSEVPRGVPLFESLLVFENYPVGPSEEGDGEELVASESGAALEVGGFRFDEEVNYPLSLTVNPGEEVALRFIYDRRRFDDEAIERMAGHFRTLLESAVNAPLAPLSRLEMLTEEERRLLLFDFNDTARPLPEGVACAHQLFERQVDLTPDAPALVDAGRTVTYAELDERANKLARYLRGLGVGPEAKVGLCAGRGAELVVGLLGILKAGGAYVALDPAYPLERLRWMMEDAGAWVLVTTEVEAERMPAGWAAVISIDGQWEEIGREDGSRLEGGAAGESLAYVVYTSGSTGRPKGVMVGHAALVNYVCAARAAFGLGPGDRMLQFLSPAFDAFGEELYPTLSSGAALVLHERPAEMSAAELLDACERAGVTALHIPPAYLGRLTEELERGGRIAPAGVRLLVTGGESLPGVTLRRWLEAAPACRVLNAYGPSEATVTSTLHEAQLDDAGSRRVAVGRPVGNVRVYVLGAGMEPVPEGVAGELYLGGAGLARGYAGEVGLTAERFVPDPFSGAAGGRLYRTGDSVRWGAGGALEFVGRGDEQVKVRGHRVELGEVEAGLRGLGRVREAAVVAAEAGGGETRLVAYVVPEQGRVPEAAELRTSLRETLPVYMIPSAFVFLESLPVTENGKIDRHALPEPEQEPRGTEAEFVAPRTPVEEALAETWKQVLGVERVGVEDDFFELGGHSLLATQIVSQVREVFQADVPLSSFFAAPTVAGLALAVARAQVEGESSEEADAVLSRLETLSDEEVELLLKAELSAAQEGELS